MADSNYTGLTLESRTVGGGDFVDFGVVVDGAFVGVHRVKATWLDAEVAAAKDAAANAAPSEPAQTTTE